MTPTGQVLRDAGLRVRFAGGEYPAESIVRGAAYEIFAPTEAPGFLPNPRPGARQPFRRYVHSADVEVLAGQPPEPAERPLQVPLSRDLSWHGIHRLSQTPRAAPDPLLTRVRRSIAIQRGTPMVKVLSAKQLAGYLTGWLPQGFCYREYDVAHLRTPADLAVLRGDGEPSEAGFVIFMLRWRAVDPLDYQIPDHTRYAGLVHMPPSDRLGPPILGTGFACSDHHLIPEYVTADLADLPLTAFAELVAYTADGSEVVLYSYLPEQRAWSRLFGPQWRHLFVGVPGVVPEQEYFSVPRAPTRLVGWHRGSEFEAVADPPTEFRVLAKTRAARYPVESLGRRTPYTTWRGSACTVVREEAQWLRLRLVHPDGDSVARLGAVCVDRGCYEVWAPAAEARDAQALDTWYDL